MLHREIIAVRSEIHTKYKNALCGQNVGFVSGKLVVRIVTTERWRVKWNFIVHFTFVLDSLHSENLCFSPAVIPAGPGHFSLLQKDHISSGPTQSPIQYVQNDLSLRGGGLRRRSLKLTIHRNLIPKFMNTLRCRLQLKCDGTRWRMGEEVKGKLANGVGIQYPSHYLVTWCIQHYYRWCAHLGCQ